MKPYRLEIEIMGLPKRINQTSGSHWSVRHREAQKWHKRLQGKMLLTRQQRPPLPLKKAKLTLIRYSSRAPDADGTVSSFKHIIDALVKEAIIIDDNYTVIGMPTYGWVKISPKQGKIKIIVEEVRNEDKP